jgi:hypothetical protein
MGPDFGVIGFEGFQDLAAGQPFPDPDFGGVYQLVNHNWAEAVDGTFVFLVLAQKRPDKGTALCSVVKVRS